MSTEMIRHLELALQKAVDAVLNDDASLDAAKTLSRSAVFATTSPGLSVWVLRILHNPDRENETLITMANWSDLDVAAGLGASLALVRNSSTPQIGAMSVAMVELFAMVASFRLTARALLDLEREAAA